MILFSILYQYQIKSKLLWKVFIDILYVDASFSWTNGVNPKPFKSGVIVGGITAITVKLSENSVTIAGIGMGNAYPLNSSSATSSCWSNKAWICKVRRIPRKITYPNTSRSNSFISQWT